MKTGLRLGLAILCLYAVFLSLSSGNANAEDGEVETSDPCSAANPSALFSLLDRPTFSDSACSVPFRHVVLESGFIRANLRGEGSGKADSYPQAEVRFGLPGRNEFKILAPNYTSQRSGTRQEASSGLSAAGIGFKHELGYAGKWLGSVEAVLTLPSGNDVFGSRGLGTTINGIVAYSLSAHVGLSLQLGISSLTDSVSAGGGRFTSFNQFFAATWNPIERLQLYGEVYGQTKTARSEGAGYNFDGGLQYLVTRWLEADLETGVRLTGNLGGFTHYYGVGIGILF
jgi:hypothetical protein